MRGLERRDAELDQVKSALAVLQRMVSGWSSERARPQASGGPGVGGGSIPRPTRPDSASITGHKTSEYLRQPRPGPTVTNKGHRYNRCLARDYPPTSAGLARRCGSLCQPRDSVSREMSPVRTRGRSGRSTPAPARAGGPDPRSGPSSPAPPSAARGPARRGPC